MPIGWEAEENMIYMSFQRKDAKDAKKINERANRKTSRSLRLGAFALSF
jgi:hypothetical protein